MKNETTVWRQPALKDSGGQLTQTKMLLNVYNNYNYNKQLLMEQKSKLVTSERIKTKKGTVFKLPGI